LALHRSHGETHPVARSQGGSVDQRRIAEDRHQIHGFHAEGVEPIVPDQEQIGSRPRDDLAGNFISGGPHDRGPETDAERRQQYDEEAGQQPPRAPDGRVRSGQGIPATGRN
jgi:hypothetical protein